MGRHTLSGSVRAQTAHLDQSPSSLNFHDDDDDEYEKAGWNGIRACFSLITYCLPREASETG